MEPTDITIEALKSIRDEMRGMRTGLRCHDSTDPAAKTAWTIRERTGEMDRGSAQGFETDREVGVETEVTTSKRARKKGKERRGSLAPRRATPGGGFR